MGFFKALMGVVVLPLDIAKDCVTLGGALTDEDQPSTIKRVGQIFDNLDEMMD